MKILIWKKDDNIYDEHPRTRIASIGLGKGNVRMRNFSHGCWLTISHRRALCRFRTEDRNWWLCILGLELSYKTSPPAQPRRHQHG